MGQQHLAHKDELEIAKLSAPKIEDWLPRPRLFHRLDNARQQSRAIWVSASPGSGKSWLLSSYVADRKLPSFWYQLDSGDQDLASFFYYLGLAAQRFGLSDGVLPSLTPEYLPGINTFARNFFRKLFEKLSKPMVIIFDNYQDVSPDSALHGLLEIALAELPREITLVFLSRGAPPPPFARARVHGQLTLIEDKDLRVDRNEMKTLAGRYKVKLTNEQQLDILEQRTRGWFAGTVLLLVRWQSEEKFPEEFQESDQQIVFDYFANEVFSYGDKTTQEVLMKTAFLSTVTAPDAHALSGVADAKERLQWLTQNQYFVLPVNGHGPAFRYHPLFRSFLQSRARDTLDVAEKHRLFQKTAEREIQAGNIDEAAELFADAKAWRELSDLISSKAPRLLAQGRFQTLGAWIRAVPESYLEKNTWLRYWLAMSQLFIDPRSAQNILIKTYESFREHEDVQGQYRSWVDIMNSILLAMDNFTLLDQWMSELDNLHKQHPAIPSIDLECEVVATAFCARAHRCEAYADVEEWSKRALALSRNTRNITLEIQVLFYRVYYGLVLRSSHHVPTDLEDMNRIFRTHDVRAVDQIRIMIANAMYSVAMRDTDACEKSVSDGLIIAHESGVFVLDIMLIGQLGWVAVRTNNLSELNNVLERLDQHKDGFSLWDRALFLNLASFHAHIAGEHEKAEILRRSNLDLLNQLGESITLNMSRLQMAILLIGADRPEEALGYVELVEKFSDERQAPHFLQSCHFCHAFVSLTQNKFRKAREHLASAFRIHPELKDSGFIVWPPQMLVRLCSVALESNVEVYAVQQFISRHELLPDKFAQTLDSWPRPIRIRTMGEFEIIKHGERVSFNGKAQKRPLALLRALIALGGQEVPTEKLCDALWPEAEGDSAQQSFKPTLHRLRKIIGASSLVLSEGRLSLDRQYCLVDVDMLEQCLLDTESILQETAPEIGKLENAVGRLTRLYRGDFLAQDLDAPWAMSQRERLRARALLVIEKAAARMGQAGHCARSRALCETGLGIHDCSETLYRGLMSCQAAHGDVGGALETYHRCRRVLSARADREPDTSTKHLRASLQGTGDGSQPACTLCSKPVF